MRVGGKNISELVEMPITQLQEFFRTLTLDAHDTLVAQRLLSEIKNRLTFLSDVGLGYLTLTRLSTSLSGGERQKHADLAGSDAGLLRGAAGPGGRGAGWRGLGTAGRTGDIRLFCTGGVAEKHHCDTAVSAPFFPACPAPGQ